MGSLNIEIFPDPGDLKKSGSFVGACLCVLLVEFILYPRQHLENLNDFPIYAFIALFVFFYYALNLIISLIQKVSTHYTKRNKYGSFRQNQEKTLKNDMVYSDIANMCQAILGSELSVTEGVRILHEITQSGYRPGIGLEEHSLLFDTVLSEYEAITSHNNDDFLEKWHDLNSKYRNPVFTACLNLLSMVPVRRHNVDAGRHIDNQDSST